MAIVGEAEILVVPSTGAFGPTLEAKTDAGLAGVGSKAAAAGEDAGKKLDAGLETGLSGVAGKADKAGEDVAKSFSSKVASGLSMLSSKVAGLGGPFTALAAPVQKASTELDKAGSSAEGTGSKMLGASKIISGVGVVAFAAATVAAVKLGIGMQTTDAQLATSAGISVKSATAIGNSFLKMSTGSVFAGIDVTKAYAGVAGQLKATEGRTLTAASANKVMSSAMNLAEASGESLTTATQDTANVMQAFHLGVGQASAATDTLFASARASGLSVDQLTNAFDKVHSKLGVLAPPLSQMSGLLVDMTEHGITGRSAMTSLTSAFTGLAAPTAAVDTAQKALGVTFVNAKTGALDPMSQIISEIGPKLTGLGNAQAVAELKSIGFGSASQNLVGILKAGPTAYNAVTTSVNKVGSAHAAAATQAQTLSHELEAMKVDVENLFTEYGEKLVPVVQKVFGVFSSVATALVKNKAAMIGIAAVMVTTVVVAIGVVIANMTALDATLAGIPLAIGLIVTGVALLATHWHQAWAAIQSDVVTAANAIIKVYNDTIGKMHIKVGGITIGAGQITPYGQPGASAGTTELGPKSLAYLATQKKTKAADSELGGLSGREEGAQTTAQKNAIAKAAADKQTAAVTAANEKALAAVQSAGKDTSAAASAQKSAATKEADAVKAQATAEAKAVTAVHTKGLAEFNQLTKAATGSSLTTLNNLLNNAHKTKLDDLEKKIVAVHQSWGAELTKKLVAAHTAALAQQTKLVAAAQAAQTLAVQNAEATKLSMATRLASDDAKATADLTADTTKLTIDQQTMYNSGATGADLVAQQAQVTLDQVTLKANAAIDSAQKGVDAASDGTALAQAQAAATLGAAQDAATTTEASATAALDIANAAATAADAATSAASAAADAAASSVDSTVPVTTTPSTSSTSPALPTPAQFQFTFNGTNMTAGDVSTEVGWLLTTGALPVAAPVGG